MLKKIIIAFTLGSLTSLMALGIFFSPAPVLAAAANPNLSNSVYEGLDTVGAVSGYSDGSRTEVTSAQLSQKIGAIISYVLAFLGVIFLVLTVMSGIQWMTAGGNAEAVKKARDRLVNAAIGLAIVMAAYAITYFVTEKLGSTTQYSIGVDNAIECDPQCCMIGTVDLCAAVPASTCRKVAGGNPTDPCSGCACIPN